MTTAMESVQIRAVTRPYPRALPYKDHDYAYRRLDEAFDNAKLVPIDRSAKYVFFSDCHRGDQSVADAFAPNEVLYLEALTHYYDQGYTYVEVGDGDELWQNPRFDRIQQAHKRVFELLHAFDDDNRLHLVFGNHDIAQDRHDVIRKDGIIARESLVLYDRDTGSKLFVVHGHQADFKSDRLYRFSRRLVRFSKRLQLAGLREAPNGTRRGRSGLGLDAASLVCNDVAKQNIERRILNWATSWRQAVICGHTHRPSSMVSGGVPYFNSGSCIAPGYVTGLELHQGQVSLVSWSGGNRSQAVRQLLSPVQALHA